MSKCINISAREILKLIELPKDWVCISINEEHERLYPLGFPEDDRVLRVRFTDIVGEITYKDKKYNPLSVENAHKILNFIDKNREKHYIVHCQASISRSSAICLFLNMIYGHKLKENFWKVSEPNPMVFGRLIIEYKRKLN